MRKIQYPLLFIILTILGGIIILHAQEECNVEDAEQVIEVVHEVCEELGDNQVCYGNFEVGTDLLDEIEELEEDEFQLLNIIFETPGDVTDVEYIKSLYLSALDPEEDTWGIAQMRLLAPTQWGARELNLLLFGDVSVDNSVDPSATIDVLVNIPANIRNLPTVDAIILQSLPREVILEAVGRLEDNTWIRVKTENGAIGWVAADLIELVNEEDSLDSLEIQDGSSPYFGPMQAFVFEQGAGSACGNLNSDGLIIQTPQGPASVNVSINGVNIDLIPAGANGAAAFIQTSGDGTSVSMIAGNSLVTSGDVTFHMSPGEQTTIGTNGIPSIPTVTDVSDLNIPGLPSISPIDTTDPAVELLGDGSVLNPDGTILNPDGTITNPDGTTTNPDGTTTNPDNTTNDGGDNTTCNPNATDKSQGKACSGDEDEVEPTEAPEPTDVP